MSKSIAGKYTGQATPQLSPGRLGGPPRQVIHKVKFTLNGRRSFAITGDLCTGTCPRNRAREESGPPSNFFLVLTEVRSVRIRESRGRNPRPHLGGMFVFLSLLISGHTTCKPVNERHDVLITKFTDGLPCVWSKVISDYWSP